MNRFATSSLILVVLGCTQPPPEPSTDLPQLPSSSITPTNADLPSSELESLKGVLTRHTWAYTTGSGAFTEAWVFRFNSDGSYLFTIVSDFTHIPIHGRWSLEEDGGGKHALRLSDLEAGKYYIIDQLSYPRYDPEIHTLTFPTAPDREGVTLHGWAEFDWDARRGG